MAQWQKTQIQRDNGTMAEAQAPVNLCEYCYANASKEKAQENYNKHEMNPLGETITGK